MRERNSLTWVQDKLRNLMLANPGLSLVNMAEKTQKNRREIEMVLKSAKSNF